ncbi:hypothetical protein [Halorubellus salinus]|uniref:hypothetical protein n=1 Tax=Halorubellus salinus TaxID=755309 RepID=UPI001D08B153|nr:hypothetical protein [Halorubellus salinus]
MRDRECPIEECSATVRFESPVVEVTPRYRLHDLGEVDEFATCPDCDAEVAGYYPETEPEGGDVELILDVDDEDDEDADATADERDASAAGFDAATDDFDDPDDVLDDPDDVLDDPDDEEASGDDATIDADDADAVFGSVDDEHER